MVESGVVGSSTSCGSKEEEEAVRRLGMVLGLMNGSSKETWKTGCKRDKVEGSLRRNDDLPCWSNILKGPRQRKSSFSDGRVVLMFCRNNQTRSPMLNGG